MHALSNDFIIINLNENTVFRDKLSLYTSKDYIQKLCNRNTGIGCDQLLIINQQNDGTKDNKQDNNYDNIYDYRIFNNDGNEVYQCGNGARCVILYLSKYATNSQQKDIELILKTQTTSMYGKYLLDNLVYLNMTNFLVEPKELFCNLDYNPNNQYTLCIDNKISLQYGMVSVGNPHIIIRLNSNEELENTQYLEYIALKIQKANLFQHGININFVVLHEALNSINSHLPLQNNLQSDFTHKKDRFIDSLNNKNEVDIIYLRTYERGVGFTTSCGSGASATVFYLAQQEVFKYKRVLVNMLGGSIEIHIKDNKELALIGSAQYVFHGVINLTQLVE